MKKDTKIILVIVVIILAWLISNGTIDIGFFSATSYPSSVSSSISSSGGVMT